MTRRNLAQVRRRQSRRWLIAFLAACAIAVGAYVTNLAVADVDPGNVWGLSYGTAAMILMLGVTLLAFRRRTMRLSSKLRLGRARSWLYFHIYAGLLFLLLMLMHGGFRLPQGTVTIWLFWLSIVTVASGLFGLALQRWIPRVLASGLTTEVHFNRIPELVNDVRERAARVSEEGHEAISDLYKQELAPQLAAPRRRLMYFIDVRGGIEARLNEFRHLRKVLSTEDRKRLDELELLYQAKLEMDAHYTLQSALRLWLISHIPVSLLLLGLLTLHLFTVYYW